MTTDTCQPSGAKFSLQMEMLQPHHSGRPDRIQPPGPRTSSASHSPVTRKCTPDGTRSESSRAGKQPHVRSPQNALTTEAGSGLKNSSGILTAPFVRPSGRLVLRGAGRGLIFANGVLRLLNGPPLSYQSTTDPSSGSNRGRYSLGSPTCPLIFSSSIVMPKPGSVSSGRCPLRTGGIGFASKSVYSLSPCS
jgi:hypothetical protein